MAAPALLVPFQALKRGLLLFSRFPSGRRLEEVARWDKINRSSGVVGRVGGSEGGREGRSAPQVKVSEGIVLHSRMVGRACACGQDSRRQRFVCSESEGTRREHPARTRAARIRKMNAKAHERVTSHTDGCSHLPGRRTRRLAESSACHRRLQMLGPGSSRGALGDANAGSMFDPVRPCAVAVTPWVPAVAALLFMLVS